MAKKRTEVGFVEKMKKLQRAGIAQALAPNRTLRNLDSLPLLTDRIRFILNIVEQNKRPAHHMLFFVMYDIENTKVRTQVAKYLLKNGCMRVQKSIFIADLPTDKYDKIRNDLTEVQACYENDDSILVVPISTDLLRAMRIIGKEIHLDLVVKGKKTLFF